MASCPADRVLERYLGGLATAEETADVVSHLDRCSTCQTRVDDAMLDDVRRVFARLPNAGSLDALAGEASGLSRYRIKGKLGEGGMGVVHEAEQRGTRRRVALKVMRQGLCSPRSIRRFEREAELLARLDHPGIARIFEADTFESGDGRLPFFAMELVEGRPPREYAEERGLGVSERLRLFQRICDAVEHAHRAGVLHRDLKPGNILVGRDGQPKVLDFGVACTLEADVRNATLESEAGGFVGTLPFMSPEQLASRDGDADVRSDVHALGVLLFQLLSGRLPHDVAGRPVAEAVRILSEEEPERLGAVDARFAGELETICGKALARDRAERYPSVAALSEDVERHLTHRPIVARRPGPLTRAAKFSRRHRALVVAASVAFASLAGGLAASLTQTIRARQAEAAAADEARVAKAVNDFLQEVLMQASPRVSTRVEPTIGEVLEEAATRIEDYTDVDPVVEAAIRHTLGRVMTDLGRFDEARRHLERALEIRREHVGERSDGVAGVLNELGRVALKTMDLEEAERLAEAGLALRRDLGAEVHPKLLGSSLNNLGFIRLQRGRPGEAVPLFEEAVRVFERGGPRARPHLRTARQLLALAYHELGRSTEAEATYRAAIEEIRAESGPDGPELATARSNFASILVERDDPAALAEAALLLDQSLASTVTRYGEEHPAIIGPRFLLGRLEAQRGAHERAVVEFEKALALVRRHMGPAAVARHLAGAASALQRAGVREPADAWLAEARALTDRGAEAPPPD